MLLRCAVASKVFQLDQHCQSAFTLQQYAGRLHREHASKTDVRNIDFVDTGHAALLKMWDKRQRGYRAMGYRITDQSALDMQTVDDHGTQFLRPSTSLDKSQSDNS